MAARLLFPGSVEEAEFIYTDGVGSYAKHASLKFTRSVWEMDWSIVWASIRSGEVQGELLNFCCLVAVLAGVVALMGWDTEFPCNSAGDENKEN